MQEDDLEDLVDFQTASLTSSSLRIHLLKLEVSTDMLDQSRWVSEYLDAIDHDKWVNLCRVEKRRLFLPSLTENVAYWLELVGTIGQVKYVANSAHFRPHGAPIDFDWLLGRHGLSVLSDPFNWGFSFSGRHFFFNELLFTNKSWI